MKHKIWQNLCTFKNLYFSKFDCKKTYDILRKVLIQYIKSFKTFHLKIPLEKNMFFEKKDNCPSYKANTLVRYMSFGPMKSIYLFYKQLGYFPNYSRHFCENKMGLF